LGSRHRRFNIIPFTQTIPPDKQDKELANKIIATELPGVFNWILEGLNRLLTQKDFSKCTASEAMLAQYKLESDSVAMFMNEKGYKPSPDKSCLLSGLYREYVTFCHEDGYRPVGKNGFSKRLMTAKFHVVRKNHGMIVYAALTPIESVVAKKDRGSEKSEESEGITNTFFSAWTLSCSKH
jgi:putative DNA primase/helicase